MIDTHCHLSSEEYKDLPSLLNTIFKNGIKAIIINGCDLKSNQEAIELANKYKGVYAAVGFHPAICEQIKKEDYILLEQQLQKEKVVAIGEIGLDYYYTKKNKTSQKQVLVEQLKLAVTYNKPVIIHNRNASVDLYNILKRYNLKGIIHSFTETKLWAQKFIDLGFLLGINGIITFENATSLQEVIKEIPLTYIVLETDAPYLTPVPLRGQQNSSLNLKYICQKISEIKGKAREEVVKETTLNAHRLFDLN